MSRDCATAWRALHEPRPLTRIVDPHTWHTYASRLYDIPGQPPLPIPPTPSPVISTLFTAGMVRQAIHRLQHGRSADHTGLHGEHFIYAVDIVSHLIAHLFNRALVEGLPDSWIMHTIAPIHKSGDMMDPGNYRTIMIGHILAKIYGAVLEEELSTHAEVAGSEHPAKQDSATRSPPSTTSSYFVP
ncbi:hypothetical protein KP509_1Z293800 [Ceratopteris richardii]|nr:hypothetical protein KP509_1Z293800 [Ceratopteris richardii]